MTNLVPAAGANADQYCFIIHDSVPYCYDINYILALPAGFRYRNRFDKNWIEGNLLDAVGNMLGKRVLIVLRDQQRNLLIPIRWGTIQLAERIGRVYYFEYILGELIKYPERDAEIGNTISQYTEAFRQRHPWLPGTQGQALDTQQPSVFTSTVGRPFPMTDDGQPSDWGNTVSAVATAAIYENTEFLKILGLRDLSGHLAPVINESFVIRPNTVYQLRVLQTIPVPDPAHLQPHDIEVVTFNDHFIQLRPTQRAVGKYDMLNFVLKSRKLAPQERSAIEIPHQPHQSQGGYAPSALYMPVSVAERTTVEISLSLAALVACLLFMFRPDIVPGDDTTIRNVATIIFILLVTGWRHTLDALSPGLPWSGGKS